MLAEAEVSSISGLAPSGWGVARLLRVTASAVTRVAHDPAARRLAAGASVGGPDGGLGLGCVGEGWWGCNVQGAARMATSMVLVVHPASHRVRLPLHSSCGIVAPPSARDLPMGTACQLVSACCQQHVTGVLRVTGS